MLRRLASFSRRRVAGMEATNRMLAFLFRRRVEKHAAELGRVLDSPRPLPAELLEQFPLDALSSSGRPVKPRSLVQIKETFAVWERERLQGSVAVVGSRGMGKSTLLRLLDDELSMPVVHARVTNKCTHSSQLVAALSELLGLSTPILGEDGAPLAGDGATRSLVDEDEMVAALRAQEPHVIALDGCHHFFLRQVGGFDAWEAFTRIVNQSADRVFWVMSFDTAAWEYLSNIAGRVSYFRKIIHLLPWSDDDLRRLLLTRMRRAGYRTSFTDLLVTRIEGVETRAQVIRTSQGYFRLLWDFTDGNPGMATHYWLRSLVPESDKKRVRVHLFAVPPLPELEALPDDINFILTAVAEHGSLNTTELAAVSNMDMAFCRFAVTYCHEHGYLARDPDTGRFRLSLHWQGTISRYLKRKHFLYS